MISFWVKTTKYRKFRWNLRLCVKNFAPYLQRIALKDLLWNRWSEFKIILKVEMNTEWPSTKIANHQKHGHQVSWPGFHMYPSPYLMWAIKGHLDPLVVKTNSWFTKLPLTYGEWYRLRKYLMWVLTITHKNVWNCLTISTALTTWEPFTMLIFSYFRYVLYDVGNQAWRTIRLVTVIPWPVRTYMDIIHEL